MGVITFRCSCGETVGGSVPAFGADRELGGVCGPCKRTLEGDVAELRVRYQEELGR